MTAISTQIWDMKYRFKAADGTPIDQDMAETWARVALALAQAEKPEVRAAKAQDFAAALTGHKFLPAGRILAGAGTGRRRLARAALRCSSIDGARPMECGSTRPAGAASGLDGASFSWGERATRGCGGTP